MVSLSRIIQKIVYNSNFLLSVVELNRIKIATEADIASGLVDWVKLFKSTTWEEIKMLAEKNEFIASASDSVARYTEDEMIRKRIEDREDFFIIQNRIQRELTEQHKQLSEKDDLIAKQQNEIAEYKKRIAELESKNS